MQVDVISHKGVSHRRQIGMVFDHIIRTAIPGDLIFFITEADKKGLRGTLRRIYRRWQGLCPRDRSIWHTAVYSKYKKESKGAQRRPYFIHAIERGVVEEPITAGYFSYTDVGDQLERSQHRIEILRDPSLSQEQRQAILDYVYGELGKPYLHLGSSHDLLTYALGIPAKRLGYEKVSCHGLAFRAYAQAGYRFGHQLKNAPFFNLGKYLGHPFFRRKDYADLNRLYLRDHHLYGDPRLELVLTVVQHENHEDYSVYTGLPKFSWVKQT